MNFDFVQIFFKKVKYTRSFRNPDIFTVFRLMFWNNGVADKGRTGPALLFYSYVLKRFGKSGRHGEKPPPCDAVIRLFYPQDADLAHS